MTVFVLFHETNSGRREESDGYVEAVYATESAANTAQLNALRIAKAQGREIWIDGGNAEWTDDWTVQAHEVIP